jgi:hypothetical protein
MDPLSTLALSTVCAAVGFYVLYLVVRAAVLSALRAHVGETNGTGPPTRT